MSDGFVSGREGIEVGPPIGVRDRNPSSVRLPLFVVGIPAVSIAV
jgi:hypothetical protein